MQVVLNARELRAMFSNLRPILRNSVDGGLLGFAIERHVLTVTCKNGVVFEQKFACEPEGPMYSTVIYRDIAELLPREGEVTLDVSEKQVHIKADQFSTIFTAAYGEVRPYTARIGQYKPCKGSTYQGLASAFAELNAVAKTLKREYSVLLVPPVAICKYPSVWLELAYEGISTSIGTRELRTIANFNPKFYGSTDEVVEFVNGSAMLAFPLNPVGECRTCSQVISNPSEPYPLQLISDLESVQSFARAVHGPCRLSFFPDGYSVQYKNQEVEMRLYIGDCHEECYYTLDTYTEYLMMVFRLIKEKQASLVVGDNAVMLEVANELRLLHSTL